MQYFEDMYNLAGCNIVAVSFRGYGYSQGVPSEKGIHRDGIAITEYVFSRGDVLDTERIFISGKTMGAAVAIYVAATAPFKLKGRIF